MALRSSYEIFSTRFWNMAPEAFSYYRGLVMDNAELRIPAKSDKPELIQNFLQLSPAGANDNKGGAGAIQSNVYAGDAMLIKEEGDLAEGDIVVNVLYVSGPIIRNGDVCSYGSMYMCDRMMRASKLPQVIGHIIVLNTPGGSTDSLRDFIRAFNDARDRGMEVNGLIKGMCASLGTGIATQCDKIYYVDPKDEIGSIGTYGALFTLENGAVNTINQATYREVYASASVDKNGWYRKAASGDLSEMEKEVNEANDEFIANILAARPSVEPSQLTGLMYKNGEVEGTLTDGQMSLEQLASDMINRYMEKQNTGTTGSTSSQSGKTNSGTTQQETTPNKLNYNISMNTNYPLLSAACDCGNDLQSDKDGAIFLNKEQAEKIEQAFTASAQLKSDLDNAQKELAESKENLLSLSNVLAGKQKENDTLGVELEAAKSANSNEELLSAHTAELDALKAAQAEALSQKETALADALASVENLKKDNNDLKSEIDELKNSAGDDIDAGASPKNNEVAPVVSVHGGFVADPSKTFAENAAARKLHTENLKNLRKQAK